MFALWPTLSILAVLPGDAVRLLPQAPLPRLLRDRPAPEEWTVADFNAVLPHPEDRGPVHVLVWERIDFGGVTAPVERCVVVKCYAAPQGTNHYALGYLLRRPTEGQRRWQVERVYPTGTKPGEPDHVKGVKLYQSAPSDTDVATFLDSLAWSHLVRPGEIKLVARDRGLREVKRYTPTLTGGGICRSRWIAAFDRVAPSSLFPELRP